MNNRIRMVLFMVSLASYMVTSCKTAEFGFNVIDLNGMVYDFSNRPVTHCEITLGERYKSSTDINGRFTLPRVPVGTYTITGSKKGFEGYSDVVTIKERGQIIYFRMPSQNQLLDLLDNALTASDFTFAEALAERAYTIDSNNIEMLFYYATVKFRQHEYGKAIDFLEAAKHLGSKDIFIDKFLAILRELQYADKTN